MLFFRDITMSVCLWNYYLQSHSFFLLSPFYQSVIMLLFFSDHSIKCADKYIIFPIYSIELDTAFSKQLLINSWIIFHHHIIKYCFLYYFQTFVWLFYYLLTPNRITVHPRNSSDLFTLSSRSMFLAIFFTQNGPLFPRSS